MMKCSSPKVVLWELTRSWSQGFSLSYIEYDTVLDVLHRFRLDPFISSSLFLDLCPTQDIVDNCSCED